jgi:predicted polyphosphate/ATP-dependent NAD kinase
MPAQYTEGDTVRAARLMGEMGVDCLVTLGGDGTNRAAARGCATMPLVAISTGTNNVLPAMVEGTVAGIAAGLVALGRLPLDRVATVSKTLEIYIDGEFQDLALVDLALSRERFVASRAIWDWSTLYEVFLTRAEPSSIGLSSVGGQLEPVYLDDDQGLRYVLGEAANGDCVSVTAPIAPGIVTEVAIAQWHRLDPGVAVTVEPRHYTVALDGERALNVNPEQQLEVVLRRNGPAIVNVREVMKEAAAAGLLRR